MAKITITFDTEDPEHQLELSRHMKSLDMACLLHEVLRNGRKKFERRLESLNSTDEFDEGYGKATDDIFDWFWEEANENGIVLEKLIE